MKRLVDELNKLDDFEYSVSPNFSKDVIRKARNQKKFLIAKSFATIASVACVAFLCVLFVRGTYVKDAAQSTALNIKAESQGKSDYQVDAAYNNYEESVLPTEEAINEAPRANNANAVFSEEMKMLDSIELDDIERESGDYISGEEE